MSAFHKLIVPKKTPASIAANVVGGIAGSAFVATQLFAVPADQIFTLGGPLGILMGQYLAGFSVVAPFAALALAVDEDWDGLTGVVFGASSLGGAVFVQLAGGVPFYQGVLMVFGAAVGQYVAGAIISEV